MNEDAVAIVGMGCIFPGAPDLASFTNNLIAGTDAISDVPADRWEPVFYDPESSAVDRFYCDRGGFIDDVATFDPVEFGIMPSAAEGAEPDQLLALKVASDALADAGHSTAKGSHERTGVIIGRGGYIGPGAARAVEKVRGAQQLVESLRSLIPELGEERLAQVKRDFQAQFGPYGPDTAIGLVPNLAASRIANRLNLGGPAYTVDAACASALVAVAQASRDLRDGISDMVIAGGVHLTDALSFWSVFSQLGALSRSGQIRPFDQAADGLLIGEGFGLVVLRRLADAERDGDRIYAVIQGCGVSSDGREGSLMAPHVQGQVLALERAWKAAGLDPADADLVEAHGTATPAGDAAELETLARFFGPGEPRRPRAGLGSVKSMIGHAMPAAGAAALIKAALAVHHGFLPPTLHVDEPQKALERTRFRLVTEAEPWERDVRTAGINAFGFGGINAHVVLESATSASRNPGALLVGGTPGGEGVATAAATFAADSIPALLDELERGDSAAEGTCRAVVLDPTPERLDSAREALERGRPLDGRSGIFFSPRSLTAEDGKTALLFTGVEATFEPRIDDLLEHFDLARPRHLGADDVERRGAAVVEVGCLLNAVLNELDVAPDMIAGHSVGEWAGMSAAGVLPEDYADAFLQGLRPGMLEIPGFVFAALGCGVERALEAIDGLASVHLSHDNCPHQTVISGLADEVESALERLRSARVICHTIPYPRGGFHTPLFSTQAESHRELYESIPFRAPRVPLWSATTCRPYPDDPAEIRELAVRHLTEPVRFRELVIRLYEEGARVFIQVGTGNLVGFVGDTLRGCTHRTIPLNVPQRSGIEQLHRASAALFVEGVPFDHSRVLRPPRASAAERAIGGRGMPLQLGVPLVQLDPIAADLGQALGTPALSMSTPDALGGAIAEEFSAVVREVLDANTAVAGALADSQGGGRLERVNKPLERITRQEFDLARFPELIDHSFIPQQDGWANIADRQPIVPMTMSIATACDAAIDLVPDSVVVAIENVRAYNWLSAHPGVEVAVRATYDGDCRVAVELEGFFEATVVVGKSWPPAPPAESFELAAARPFPITPRQVYDDGWAFHGPTYQGIRSLDALGDDGMRASIEALSARGAFLDAAGQLVGIWLAVSADVDQLALPVKVERFEFFAPVEEGQMFDVDVRVRRCGRRELTGDLQISRNAQTVVKITGWQDWRFPVTPDLYRVMRSPGRELLALPHASGLVVLDGTDRTAWAREWLARRYLGERERDEFNQLPEQRQQGWLSGRIAAKDAVRQLLFQEGFELVYPAEVEVVSDPSGRPTVVGLYADVQVSLAHKGAIAVAVAARGASPGTDIEFVEPRDERFVARAFNEAEVDLVPTNDRDAWITRFWSAKEALAKARGTGIVSGPRELSVTSREGERVFVDGVCVETRCEGDRVVAWTSL